jgi:hypothetical protein
VSTSKSYSTESRTPISTPYYLQYLIRTARFARSLSTGSSFASLGRADRGSAPETPRKSPFRGLRLRREGKSTPTARERIFPSSIPCLAPSAPFATLRDVPPPSLRSEGELASERGSLPLTDARTISACHAGRSKEKRILASLLLKRIPFPRRPLGAEHWGIFSVSVSELHSYPVSGGTGAEPLSARPSEAKGETIPFSHRPSAPLRAARRGNSASGQGMHPDPYLLNYCS